MGLDRIRRNRLIGWILGAAFLAGCAGGSEEDSSDSVAVGVSLVGSVGDGPIVGATVTVLDADGNLVRETQSDGQASYEVAVPDGVPLPLTVQVSGGIDLVTGRAPDFPLAAVTLRNGQQTVNVSPLTTLATEAASCAGKGYDPAQLEAAWTAIEGSLGMGWRPSIDGDPMSDAVDAGNAEALVLANEALGEVLRRAEAALAASSSAVDAASVMTQLACDLVDGALDGVGPDVDPRVVASVRMAEAAVLLEVIAGRLEVDGADATALMNQALASILPAASDLDVRDVPVTGELLARATDTLTLLAVPIDDSSLLDALQLLEGVTPGTARAAVDGALDASLQNDLQALPELVALADSTVIDATVERMAQQEVAAAPSISLSARDGEVPSGSATQLSWASANADRCVASGAWSGERGVEGSESTGALTAASTFELTCVGLGGSTQATARVTIEGQAPPPAVTLSAASATVDAGSSTTLSWSSTDAESCTASGDWSGSRSTQGSTSTGSLQDDASYTLTCTGPGGSASDSVSVTVSEPAPPPAPEPTVSLDAADSLIDAGASTTLSWSSSNADSCSASGGWSGSRSTSGSATVGPLDDSTSFTLTCTGPGGSALAMLQVEVTGELALAWQAPTENVDGSPLDDLSGYKIYYGTSSRNYDASVSIDDPSATSGSVIVVSGDYYVAMTAIDADGNESAYSNEVLKATQ